MNMESDNTQGEDNLVVTRQDESPGIGWVSQGLILLGIAAAAASVGFVASHFFSADAGPLLEEANVQGEPPREPVPPLGGPVAGSAQSPSTKEASNASLPAAGSFFPPQGSMNRDSPAAVVSSGDSPLPFPTTTAAAIGEVCQVVDRLTQSLPNQPDVLEIKARLELWRGNTAEARKSWEKCLERNPNYAYAYVGMGSIAAKKGDYAVAADLYRKALALDPTASETRVQLGSALIDSGQPKEAIAVLGQAVGADRAPVRRLVLLGMASLQIADYAMAKTYYELAIRNDRNHANAHHGLAMACLHLGLKEESRKYLEKFNQLRSEEYTVRKQQRAGYDDVVAARAEAAILLTQAGGVCMAAKQEREAERLWKRASALDVKSVSCRQALAWLCYHQGRTMEAVGILGEVAAIEPANPAYPMEIGRLLAQLKEIERRGGLVQARTEAFAPRPSGICRPGAALPCHRPQTVRGPNAGPQGGRDPRIGEQLRLFGYGLRKERGSSRGGHRDGTGGPAGAWQHSIPDDV